MRNDPTLLNLLCCPLCQKDLRVGEVTATAPDGHIMTGDLVCTACGNKYPIVRGVPQFTPDAISDEVETTVKGFGFQWQRADPLITDTKFKAVDTFLDFIKPVEPAYFADKVVLDGGCGSGRFSHWAQQFGAKAVFGVDLSESVDTAFNNTRGFPNVIIVQADLLSLPLRQAFDYAFSIGVLHHTDDPRGAFDGIVSRVRPGGGMSAWVYSRENNEWIVNILNPIRRHLTSRLPHPILRLLSYVITVPLFLLLKGVYRPVGKSPRLTWLRSRLLYFDYLYFLSGFGFHEQALIVFDHMVPTISEYIPREEFQQWFDENGLHDVVITSRAGNSWRGFGIR